jgi:UDP-N-acetylmuramate dehydrogenase
VDGVVLLLSRLRTRRGFHVQAGYGLPRLARETADAGLSGLEALAGVPASVGGAVAMNAGGRHGEIADAIDYVDVLTPEGGIRRLARADVPFRYRSWGLAGHVALAAGFRLSPDPAARARFDGILADKKATQPLGSANAGCVFKNPPGARAGAIIDAAGLKGTRVGPAHVSTKHANFIINDGGARAGDVLRVIDIVRDAVRTRFGVALVLEVVPW